jgi:hypothetical protein
VEPTQAQQLIQQRIEQQLGALIINGITMGVELELTRAALDAVADPGDEPDPEPADA